MKTRLFLLLSVVLAGGAASALTKHYSFAPRQSGRVGGASVVAPAPKKAADALDLARQKQYEAKELSIIGRVTSVESGDTLYVTPTGGSKTKVHLSRVMAPQNGQVYAAESLKALKDLVNGKKVTVKYRAKDQSGTVYGVVWLGKEDVNLKLLKAGSVLHNFKSDQTESYVDAARDAKLSKAGIWSTGVKIEVR